MERVGGENRGPREVRLRVCTNTENRGSAGARACLCVSARMFGEVLDMIKNNSHLRRVNFFCDDAPGRFDDCWVVTSFDRVNHDTPSR